MCQKGSTVITYASVYRRVKKVPLLACDKCESGLGAGEDEGGG